MIVVSLHLKKRKIIVYFELVKSNTTISFSRSFIELIRSRNKES